MPKWAARIIMITNEINGFDGKRFRSELITSAESRRKAFCQRRLHRGAS